MQSISTELDKFEKQILYENDKLLFHDAIISAKGNALRASYIMIWLSCAEALKFRFQKAQVRDNIAQKIVSDINKKESEHKSVDKFILDESKKYGFISDSEYSILCHIYEMRCLYGHPYNEAPTKEQILHAASVVVNAVLIKPIMLKEGFCSQLINELMTIKNYLDNHQTVITQFAVEIIKKIDPSIYDWFLEKYWTELEKIANDPSMSLFFKRGCWFSRAMVLSKGVESIATEKWHSYFTKYPKTLINICNNMDIFLNIGELAQDFMIGTILDESIQTPSVLSFLGELLLGNVLNDRQNERIKDKVLNINTSDLIFSNLSIVVCFDKVISALKSYNWYTQNPIIQFIINKGPSDINNLDENQQQCLGRNILQAAEGSSAEACRFLELISTDVTRWPHHMIMGIAKECFINDNYEIRFKHYRLLSVLTAMDSLNIEKRNHIVDEIYKDIDFGRFKHNIDTKILEEVDKKLSEFSWTHPIRDSLKAQYSYFSAHNLDC